MVKVSASKCILSQPWFLMSCSVRAGQVRRGVEVHNGKRAECAVGEEEMEEL